MKDSKIKNLLCTRLKFNQSDVTLTQNYSSVDVIVTLFDSFLTQFIISIIFCSDKILTAKYSIQFAEKHFLVVFDCHQPPRVGQVDRSSNLLANLNCDQF